MLQVLIFSRKISDMVQRKLEKMRYVGTDAKGISEGPPVMTSQGGTEVRYGQTRQTSSSQGL